MGTSTALHVRRSVLVTATAFVVVLAACGSAGQDAGRAVETSVQPSSSSSSSSITNTEVVVERRPAEDITTDTDVVSDYEWADPRSILYAAPIVLVGTVTGVQGPFWNAADGQKWEKPPRTADSPVSVAPGIYREIVIDIETVVRDDYEQVGTTITMVATGAGEGSNDPNAFRGGRFTVGERVLVFVATNIQFGRDDIRAVFRPFRGGFQSVYHVGADGIVMPDGAAQSIEVEQNQVVAPGDPTPPPVVRDFMTLGEFVAMVESARSVRNEEWELYRRDPGDVDAQVEFMKEMLEIGVTPEASGRGVSE